MSPKDSFKPETYSNLRPSRVRPTKRKSSKIKIEVEDDGMQELAGAIISGTH